MAYREFHYEKTYAKPDNSQLLVQASQNAAHAIGNIFQAIHQKNEQRKINADEYKYTLAKGSSENDNIYFEEGAKAVTELMKHGIRNNDPDSQQKAIALMKTLAEQHQERRVQDETFKMSDAAISDREKNDKYYDGNADRRILGQAYFGPNHDSNFLTRKEALDQAAQIAGNNPRALKAHEYTADYVKDLGTTKKAISTGNPNATSTRYNESPFWDEATGAKGVTDRHAIDYLKSRPDGSVQHYYEAQVNDQLDNEVQQMKSVKDDRTEWMKGLSDNEIKSTLVNDPSKNIINKQDYGVRVRGLAKEKLRDAANISSKVDVEYKKDSAKTGGLYNNDSIAHSDTFYNEKVGTDSVPDNVAGAFRMNQNAAPGGILMINKGTTTGKPISFQSGSKSIFNVNSGTVQQARGTAEFNLTGYQIQAYDKEGKPYMIEASSPAELKKAIQNIPHSDFKNLEPEMKIALKGYSINKGRLMGDIRSSTYSLNEKLAKATADNNPQEVAKLQGQLFEINNLRQQLNADPDDFVDDDILNAAAKNGITSVRTDQLVKADKADLDKINTITEGLNLSKQDKWSPEMREINDLYKKRAQEAAATGYQGEKVKKKSAKKTPTTSSQIVSEDQYNALPSGTEYIGPDGIKRRKK